MTLIDSSSIFRSFLPHLIVGHLQNARILVTGGSGLVGGYLVSSIARACKFQGVSPEWPIVVTHRRNNHFLHELAKEGLVRLVKLEDVYKDSKSRFTHTFHAASAASPKAFADTQNLKFLNIEILPALLTITSEVFLFFSSGEIYGSNAPSNVQETFNPETTSSTSLRHQYPFSKLAGESLLNSIADKSPARTRIVRLFHTFGPGISPEDVRTFSNFIYDAINKQSITMYSKGDQIRTFLHLADTVRGLMYLSDPGLVSEHCATFNLGSTSPHTIRSFAETVAKITQAKILEDYQSPFELSDRNVLVPSTSKMQLIGWNEEVNLQMIVEDTISWLIQTEEQKQF